jgi:hypothetical protein
MNALTHEGRDRLIDQPVARELRPSTECLGDDHHAEVAAFAGARVTGVTRAVVDDLEGAGRKSSLDRLAKLLNPG